MFALRIRPTLWFPQRGSLRCESFLTGATIVAFAGPTFVSCFGMKCFEWKHFHSFFVLSVLVPRAPERSSETAETSETFLFPDLRKTQCPELCVLNLFTDSRLPSLPQIQAPVDFVSRSYRNSTKNEPHYAFSSLMKPFERGKWTSKTKTADYGSAVSESIQLQDVYMWLMKNETPLTFFRNTSAASPDLLQSFCECSQQCSQQCIRQCSRQFHEFHSLNLRFPSFLSEAVLKFFLNKSIHEFLSPSIFLPSVNKSRRRWPNGCRIATQSSALWVCKSVTCLANLTVCKLLGNLLPD